MNESGLDSPPKITPELIRADMQRFMTSSYGRPNVFPSGFSENRREFFPVVIGEIISTENTDPRTLLKMCSYLVDMDQTLIFDYFSGKDYTEEFINGPSSADLRRKIFEGLQANLYDLNAADIEDKVTLFSWFRHNKHRGGYGSGGKTKFPERLRYGKDETEMLRRKMPPVQALNYMKTVIAAELRDLEKPQGR